MYIYGYVFIYECIYIYIYTKMYLYRLEIGLSKFVDDVERYNIENPFNLL
jgi:hypothetical protein